MSNRRVQGDQAVLQRANGASQPPKQPRGRNSAAARGRRTKASSQPLHLRRPVFDEALLASKTFLTVPMLAQYGSFKSEHAAWCWLGRNGHLVPKVRRGRSVTIRRRDYDLALTSNRSHVAHGTGPAPVAEGDL